MIDVVRGLIHADIGDVALGEICRLERSGDEPLEAEVLGFQNGRAILMPYDELTGIRMGTRPVPSGAGLRVRCGEQLRGVVLNGLGRPWSRFEQRHRELAVEEVSLARPKDGPEPLGFGPALSTGTRAIDGCLTLAEGQRIGLYFEIGVGAWSLLGRIAAFSSADVVVAHIDSSYRAVSILVEEELEPDALDRMIVVTNLTSEPAIVHLRGMHVAHRLAEYLRDQGQRVLLLLFNLRAHAHFHKEVAMQLGEPLDEAGFPPSVYSALARLISRTARTSAGSITTLYGVRMTDTDTTRDPIASLTRVLFDGHIVMNQELARRNHWPAIDVSASLSRSMNATVSRRHKQLANELRQSLRLQHQHREAVEAGTYAPGQDPDADRALARIDGVNAFLQQAFGEKSSVEDAVERLERLFGKNP